MKGLIISLGIFVLYVLSSMFIFHLIKPRRQLRTFVVIFLLCSPLYFVAYWMLPNDVFFLPSGWMSRRYGLDLIYGYAVFLLNFHSYVDFFFACNGGFSMCLMLEILRSEDRGITVEELTSGFIGTDAMDKIYARRLPHLEKAGLITIDRERGEYRITGRGRMIALINVALKRFLNLQAGG